ncbi:ABC transporter substrate-binding protein [Streptomyces sp. DSM 44917]|uniref:ABC transporter substrate-binding protein n=1 Tax=Streptomyces boetiae TaxID=3075541 RepID=A0ABU2L8Y1_9ACTN|nr:ABC transporter substrate-binding protein [Streptomyces sp. DSM 44917]MDT0307931.1 ABC transporter substrate-binding protein [Streptomyces sp. DSM 44917]
MNDRRIPGPLRRRPAAASLAAVALVALAATACSGKAEEEGGGGGGADGVATDIGVSDSTITLGALTDMTGPYATLGASVTQAQQLWADQTNDAGGICGRDVELVVRDHGYDAEQAVSAYSETSSQVLAYSQFIGSAYVNTVRERIDGQDQVLVLPQAWSADLLGSEYIQMVGSTYDLETINAIDFLAEEFGLGEGDTLGHVYFEGAYGENALAGSRHAAEELGLSVAEQRIAPTDEDMTAQVRALAGDGVDAIVVSAGPRQAASVAGVAAAAGLEVPIIGNNSAFAPQLLDTGAGPALLANYYVASPALPIGAEEGTPAELSAAYAEAYPDDQLDNGVAAGYSAISLLGQALEAACEAEDLTREGVAQAMLAMTEADNGFGIAHDFSDPAAPSSTESYILRPDADTPGGLTVLGDPFTSPLTDSYTRE